MYVAVKMDESLTEGLKDQPDLTKTLREYIEYFSKGLDSKGVRETASSDLLKQLSRAYNSGSLTLVLGAGVSLDYGLPSWNTLLQTLLARTFKKDRQESGRSLLFAEVFDNIFSPNALVAARYLSNEYKGEVLGFEKEVRELLYGQIKGQFTSPLMAELVQLCAAPGKSPNLDSIITYNYDDILESELDKATIKVPYKSIFKSGQNPLPKELPIFHVHGYVPRDGELSNDNRITLGEDLYHHQYTNVYNWENLTQLNKFKDTCCLFIGSSLNDPNQRRLLDIAYCQKGQGSPPQHFILKQRYSPEAIKNRLKDFLETNSSVISKKEQEGIDFEELAKFMIDAVHKFEVNDSLSLGVQILWVDTFKEIPGILQAMRK